MAESEVARITGQIETECVAMKRAFSEFSATARHRIIQHKYAAIGNHRKQLEQLVGDEKAKEIVGRVYVEVMEDES